MSAVKERLRRLALLMVRDWQCELCSKRFQGPPSQRCPACS